MSRLMPGYAPYLDIFNFLTNMWPNNFRLSALHIIIQTERYNTNNSPWEQRLCYRIWNWWWQLSSWRRSLVGFFSMPISEIRFCIMTSHCSQVKHYIICFTQNIFVTTESHLSHITIISTADTFCWYTYMCKCSI